MKRTPLQRKTPLRRSSTLKQGSNLSRKKAPRRRSLAVDKDLYTSVLARDGGCVARTMIPEVRCFGRIDPHHQLMRSQGGKDSLDNLIAVCRSHHDWIHGHPARSYEMDLLRHPDRTTTDPKEDSCGN